MGGETVTLQIEPEVAVFAEPEPIALDIVYEDESLIVIDKAAITRDGRTVEQLYGRTEQVLQELHFEPREGAKEPAPG